MSTGCSSVLSGFLRRLFLQVLLEDEHLLVCVNSQQPMYKVPTTIGTAGQLHHPRFGVGHCIQCLHVSINSTVGELLGKVSGKTSYYLA